jgi:uncharacterized protein (DUF3084 family)
MLDKLNEKTKEASELANRLRQLEPKIQEMRTFHELKERMEKEIHDLKQENIALKQESDSYRQASSKNFQDLFSMKEQLGDQSTYLKKLEDEVKMIPELQQKLTMVICVCSKPLVHSCSSSYQFRKRIIKRL